MTSELKTAENGIERLEWAEDGLVVESQWSNSEGSALLRFLEVSVCNRSEQSSREQLCECISNYKKLESQFIFFSSLSLLFALL